MRERPAKPGFVVTELALGDGEILAGGCCLAVIAAGQPVEGVEYRPRPGIPGERPVRVVSPSRYSSGAPNYAVRCQTDSPR